MSSETKLAVVIVNYGAADFIIAHLNKTLKEVEAFSAARIYIADNRSPGGDFDVLNDHVAAHALQERVTIIDTGGNLGFAGGNNAAFAAFGDFQPDLIFMMNPDAWPEPGTFAQLAQTLKTHPDAAIAAPRIIDEHGVTAISYFKFPSIIDQYISETELGFLHRLTSWTLLDLEAAQKPIETDWVSGAAFMLRASAATAPPMDDGYFLYFEETDMMRTLTRNGHRILIEPAARVVHIGGLTTGAGKDPRDKRLPVHWYNSWRRYFVKQYGHIGALLAALLKIAGIATYYLKQNLNGRGIFRPKRYLRDFMRHALITIFTAGRN